MGRKSKMTKEAKKAVEVEANPSFPELSLMISPNVDYDNVSNSIAQLEKLAEPFAMMDTGSAVKFSVAPPVQSPSIMGSPFQKDSSLHLPVGSELTGRTAIGHTFNAPNTHPSFLKDIEVKKAEALEDTGTIPINEDFLNFLLVKEKLSFGWIVDANFLANFFVDPALFNETDEFIFWVVPSEVKMHRISTAGFQRSESHFKKTLPHMFLLKIISRPPADSDEDPFTKMINDPVYINLRKELDKRGIQFLYDLHPNQLWISLQNRISAKA